MWLRLYPLKFMRKTIRAQSAQLFIPRPKQQIFPSLRPINASQWSPAPQQNLDNNIYFVRLGTFCATPPIAHKAHETHAGRISHVCAAATSTADIGKCCFDTNMCNLIRLEHGSAPISRRTQRSAFLPMCLSWAPEHERAKIWSLLIFLSHTAVRALKYCTIYWIYWMHHSMCSHRYIWLFCVVRNLDRPFLLSRFFGSLHWQRDCLVALFECSFCVRCHNSNRSHSPVFVHRSILGRLTFRHIALNPDWKFSAVFVCVCRCLSPMCLFCDYNFSSVSARNRFGPCVCTSVWEARKRHFFYANCAFCRAHDAHYLLGAFAESILT